MLNTMRRVVTILAVAILALAAGALFLASRPLAATQSLHFTRYTNGIVGAVAPVFSALTPSNAVTVQKWLAAGTNVAEFTLTNRLSCAIWLFPLGRICTDEPPKREYTPLLNAPNFSGILVPPGQTATVQVALLPHRAPWRLEVCYHRDSGGDTLLNRLRLLEQTVLAATTGQPIQQPLQTITSEWIER